MYYVVMSWTTGIHSTTFTHQGENRKLTELFIYMFTTEKAYWGTRIIIIWQWNQTDEIQCNRNKNFLSLLRHSVGIQVKNANIKAARPIFYINTFQNFISEAAIDKGFRGDNLWINILPSILCFTDFWQFGKLGVITFKRNAAKAW